MSSHFRQVPAAATRQATRAHSGRWFLIAAALTIQGCAAAPTRPLAGPDPDDPDVRVRPVIYRSTVADFKSMQPSEPAPWRERNDSVAPPVKKDGP
jgi:hypothetical protein